MGDRVPRRGRAGFLAGADLKARRDYHARGLGAPAGAVPRLFKALRDVPQPMIAAVHGYALGGGTELALLADMVIAADDAVFGLTEVSLGIIPGGGGTQNLPRLIGRNRAKELIFTARRIDADEALSPGLGEPRGAAPELLDTAVGLAQEIMQNSPFSVRQAKWAIDKGADLPFEEGLRARARSVLAGDRVGRPARGHRRLQRSGRRVYGSLRWLCRDEAAVRKSAARRRADR